MSFAQHSYVRTYGEASVWHTEHHPMLCVEIFFLLPAISGSYMGYRISRLFESSLHLSSVENWPSYEV